MRVRHALVIAAVCHAPLAIAQNNSLRGKYFLRQMQIQASPNGAVAEARSLSAAVNFDGQGGFTYTGQSIVGGSAEAAVSGSGAYSADTAGVVTLTSPLRAIASVNARLADGVLAGSSTNAGDGLFDLMVAIPAPSTPVTASALSGTWWVATVEFPNGGTAAARAAHFRLNPGGGAFPEFIATGQAANLGSRPLTQTVSGATFTLNSDGAGSANFPLPSGVPASQRLVAGNKQLFLSADGRFLLMGSTSAGAHDFAIGVRAFSGNATAASLKDLYWTAGLQFNRGRFNSSAGSANSLGSGTIYLTRRVRGPEGAIDFTGINRYNVAGGGSGNMEANTLLLGAEGRAFLLSGVALSDPDNFELGLGFRAPALPAGQGVYLAPYGVVNAASFAPPGNPISPGQFVTLFGAGLSAGSQTAASTPFPATLGGTQVLVDNIPAPLYSVSPTQVSLVVPQLIPPAGTVTIAVVSGGQRSNAVQVPMANSAPGVFTVPPAGFGNGAILKTDYSLVSPSNPAKRGDTVLIFLTGLGRVSPVVPDGAAAPASPLSRVLGNVNVYVGGERATVTFKGLAPGLVSLNQLNVVIPASAPSGNVPLAIETGEAFHDQVNIAIAP